MTATPRLVREMDEVPCFTGLDATSFTYAFELCCGNDAAWAFRVGWIHDALETQSPDAYAELIEPVRSFLEDVTTGGPGINGRPMICLASGAGDDDVSRRVQMIRPAQWRYQFENCETLLTRSGPASIAMRLRDSFAIFESGRIFYLMTLTQPTGADGAAVDPLNEYGVLQLQRLMLNRRHAANREYLGFAFETGYGPPHAHSLVGLAQARLQRLPKITGHANAIVDIIERFDLIACGAMPEIGIERLKGLCAGIESEDLLAIGKCADLGYANGAAVKDPPDPPDCEAQLLTAWRAAGRRTARPHLDKACKTSRALLAFSGIAQGVPDFPWQDDSEIHDSTRPTATSVESSLYVHPKFVLEIAKSWRSFQTGRNQIGTCPYLLLMWIVALHDELTVQDMEQRLHVILFGKPPSHQRAEISPHQLRIGARSRPLGDVHLIVAGAQGLAGQPIELLKTNLSQRLEMFRWTSIHQSENLFRYPKERGALTAIQTALGTRSRFDRAHQKIDRVESLVEDSAALKSAYSDRRTNLILFLIAILSVVNVSDDLIGHFGRWPPDWQFFAPALLILLCVAGVMAWERLGRRE